MKRNHLITGVFAAVLTCALAATSVFAGNNNNNGKDDDESIQVTICHNPPGNPDNPQTITIGEPAVLNAHLNHGDQLGACPEEDKDESKDDGSKDDGSKDDESKDDDSKDKDGTCACPPGAASCVCADGTSGTTSPASLTSPASQRDIRGQ